MRIALLLFAFLLTTVFSLNQSWGQSLTVRGKRALFFCESHEPSTQGAPGAVNLITRRKISNKKAEKLLRLCLQATVSLNAKHQVIGTAWYNPHWTEGNEKMIKLDGGNRHLMFDPKTRKIRLYDPIKELLKK